MLLLWTFIKCFSGLSQILAVYNFHIIHLFPPILQKKKERKKLCKPHLFRRFCSVNRPSLPFPNNREGSTQVTGKIPHHQRRERQRWLEFRGISQSEVARGYRLKCFHFVSEEEIPWRRFISLPNVSSKKKKKKREIFSLEEVFSVSSLLLINCFRDCPKKLNWTIN